MQGARGVVSAISLFIAVTAWAATTHSGATKRMFTDNTYGELQPFPASERLLAVVRCEAIEVLNPGSRSERQQVRATPIAGASGATPGNSLLLSRYAQGKPVMDAGKTYLVVAYRESPSGPWTLLEHRPVDAAAASREYEAARADLSARLDGAKPR